MAARRAATGKQPAARKRATPKKRGKRPFVGKHIFAKGKVSSKGWVVIPKEIRDEMGIKPGDEVQFSLWPPSLAMKQDPGLYALHVHRMSEDPVALGYGMFPQRPGEPSWTEQLVEERRREAEMEERKTRARRKRRSA